MTEGIPTLTSGMPNFASCAAMRKSQAGCDLEAAAEAPARHPRHHPGAGNARHSLAEIAQSCDEFSRREA